MSNKDLRYRCTCPYCRKVFDSRTEGFVVERYLICAECYYKYTKFITNKE